jgi:hypothetical protein
MKKLMKKINHSVNTIGLKIYFSNWGTRILFLLGLLSLRGKAWADIPTPDPNDDPTQGHDFFDVLKNIIANEAGPIVIYGGAIFLVGGAVVAVARSYKKAQDTEDYGNFKISLIWAVVMIVIAISLLFLGQYIDQQWQNGQ